MKIAQLFILILAFLVIKPVQAGLLLEPVLGYSMSKFEPDAEGASESKANGASWGGRIGYQNLGFQLGLDYLNSNQEIDESKFLKDEFTSSEWAAFVGFEFPILFRAYAGYIFSANAEGEYKDGTSVDLKEGTGMKVGFGFTGLPFVDLNLEYRKGTYSKFKDGDGSANMDTDFSAIMLGVSLPFVI